MSLVTAGTIIRRYPTYSSVFDFLVSHFPVVPFQSPGSCLLLMNRRRRPTNNADALEAFPTCNEMKLDLLGEVRWAVERTCLPETNETDAHRVRFISNQTRNLVNNTGSHSKLSRTYMYVR